MKRRDFFISLLVLGWVAGLSVVLLSCSPGDRLPKNPVAEMAIRAPEGYPNKVAVQKNEDGIDHLVWGHWRKAEADFRRAIAADPNLAAAHFNLALSLNELGNHSEAAEHFRKAKELAPNDPRITENETLKNALAR
jgi:Tfp pilus assembly protein PilF